MDEGKGPTSGGDENRVKGIAIRNFPAVLAGIVGEDAAGAVVRELPAALRELLPKVVPSAWYPIGMYRTMHATARRVLRAGDALPRQIGYASTERDLTGVYRIFLSILAPQTILAASSRVFRRYYERGSMSVPEMRAGYARVALSDCAGFDHNVFQDVIGGSEAGLVLAGAKHVRIHGIVGGQDGDTFLEVAAHWTT